MTKEDLSSMTPSGIMSKSWYLPIITNYSKGRDKMPDDKFGGGSTCYTRVRGVNGFTCPYDILVSKNSETGDTLSLLRDGLDTDIASLFMGNDDEFCVWYDKKGQYLAELKDDDFGDPFNITDLEFNIYTLSNPEVVVAFELWHKSINELDWAFSDITDEAGALDTSKILKV